MKYNRLPGELTFKKGECRAIGAYMYDPSSVDRVLNQRRYSGRVPHAPIEDGKEDRGLERRVRVHPCEVQ